MEEEFLGPPENEDYFSQATENSLKYRRMKRQQELAQKIKERYHEKIVYNPVKQKNIRIGYYDSGFTPNHCIRDAITGRRTHYRIGTTDEELFFKVKMATGENGGTPISLFFETMADYEHLFFVNLDSNVKKYWSERNSIRMKELEKKRNNNYIK